MLTPCILTTRRSLGYLNARVSRQGSSLQSKDVPSQGTVQSVFPALVERHIANSRISLWSRSYCSGNEGSGSVLHEMRGRNVKNPSGMENRRSRPGIRADEGDEHSERRNRVSEEDSESELFGLDQFAAKVHLGKPSGSIHDPVLERMRRHILELAKTEDEVGVRAYLASIRDQKTFEKEETRGRLLWSILRSYGLRLDEREMKRRVWAARQMISVWAYGERAGYLWGVMIDALNKSDQWPLCVELWEGFSQKRQESPENYELDLPFVITARLSGAIEAFRYSEVDSMLGELVDCSSADVAAWAFARCLTKSLMIHQNAISELPNWNGGSLQSIELRAAHFAPLLADVGCVDAARNHWIQDHTALYKHDAPIPTHHAEARLEMEHLRAGLLIFARAPRLESPHDTILALIVERFERLLRSHPHLCVHNHGLLYSLSRSNYYWLSSHLAHIFLQLGSNGTIVSASMIPMCIREGDSSGYQYWLAKRNPDDSSHFGSHDRFHRWILKASTLSIADLTERTISTNTTLPLQHLVWADTIIRRRYRIGKALSSPPSHIEEDMEMDAEEVSTLVMTDSGAGDENAPPLGSDAAIIAPYITRPNPTIALSPLSEEEYQKWQTWVDSLVLSKRVGLQDLHSTQKLMLTFTVPGRFHEAEDVVLSSYRTNTAKQDLAIMFLLTCFAEHRMFPRMIKLARKSTEHRPDVTLDRLVGPAKLLALFKQLVNLDTPSFYILELWNVVRSPNLVSALLPILTHAVIDFGDTKQAESLAEQLFLAARYRVTSDAIPAAKSLQQWLSEHRRIKSAKGLLHWIKEYEQPERRYSSHQRPKSHHKGSVTPQNDQKGADAPQKDDNGADLV